MIDENIDKWLYLAKISNENAIKSIFLSIVVLRNNLYRYLLTTLKILPIKFSMFLVSFYNIQKALCVKF